MANKRQRDARKRQQGPVAAPQAGKDEQHKKNKVVRDVSSKRGKTHPLRVAGKKPGDGCFICKSKDHIAKFCPTKSEYDRKKICLLCRERGHTLKHCPQHDSTQANSCYNCGETGHKLGECPQPLKDGGTSFAACFFCKERGHISKNCPQNSHGVYPKGGCCKTCGEVTHLAKDCPKKDAKPQRFKLTISKDVAPEGKRTVFKSGDDLDDDYEDGE